MSLRIRILCTARFSLSSSSDFKKLVPVLDLDLQTTLCLASAHALVLLEEAGVVGDPMEKTTLDAIKWKLSKGDNLGPAPLPPPPKAAFVPPPPKNAKVPIAPPPEPEAPPRMSSHKGSVQIKRRFQFSSALKRMATISIVQSSPEAKRRVLISVKGAPETLKGMFVKVPAEYEKTYKGFAQRGSRVLALGYKWADGMQPDKVS